MAVRGPWQPLVTPTATVAVYRARASGHVRPAAPEPAPAAPASDEPAAAAPPDGRCLVVCPGLPTEPGAAERTGRTFPALADRLAGASGWAVLACCLRAVGGCDGSFSFDGWLADLRAVVDHAARHAAASVWLAGFGLAGAVALRVAATDQRVRGVATLGAPASLERWLGDPQAAVAAARRVGVLPSAGQHDDPEAWAAAGRSIAAEDAARALGGRALLVVHGLDDDIVPAADARRLAAACPGAELRLLAGAGHRLRADPRAIALLLGWLERQGP